MPEADAPRRSHPALWVLSGLLLAGMGVLRFVREHDGNATVSYALGTALGTVLGALLLAGLIVFVFRKLRRSGRRGVTPGLLGLAAALAFLAAVAQAGNEAAERDAAIERQSASCTEPTEALFSSPPEGTRFVDADAETREQLLASYPPALRERADVRRLVRRGGGFQPAITVLPLGDEDPEDARQGFLDGARSRGAGDEMRDHEGHRIAVVHAKDDSYVTFGMRGCLAATVIALREQPALDLTALVLGR